MKKINSKKEVEKRNEKFLKEFLDLTLEEYFAKMRLAGKPKKFANGIWSDLNPTAGRCGSVIGALRISNKIPKGYIPCGQKEAEGGSHFYMINPITNEVIDPTNYQMKKEYNYENYHTRFLPQLSKNVSDILTALELKIDQEKYQIKLDKRGVTLICKKNKNELN
jgi:hypothetical protein